MSVKEKGIEIGIQIIKAKARAIIGAKINKVREEGRGWIGSLINSLTPSATGWSRPTGPIILGPLRNCI